MSEMLVQSKGWTDVFRTKSSSESFQVIYMLDEHVHVSI